MRGSYFGSRANFFRSGAIFSGSGAIFFRSGAIFFRKAANFPGRESAFIGNVKYCKNKIEKGVFVFGEVDFFCYICASINRSFICNTFLVFFLILTLLRALLNKVTFIPHTASSDTEQALALKAISFLKFIMLPASVSEAGSCFVAVGLFAFEMLNWNNSIGDKWANELIFLIMCIIPVYEISVVLDSIFLNTIEFWTGENPISDLGYQTIEGKDGMYAVECRDVSPRRTGNERRTEPGRHTRFPPGSCQPFDLRSTLMA
ncbi:MAG: DUF3332 domain-containing protein [Tannerellaceae bacterium]|nr:DUF3332 domain-containing protein [Tannerellaceae bacterium]